MKTTFIYVLKDPETGAIRYVGKSNSPKSRLRGHKWDAGNDAHHRACWIRSLLSRGMSPQIEIVDEVPEPEWPAWEVAWISFFREEGCDLTNTLDGGECPPSRSGKPGPRRGVLVTELTRSRMSKAKLGTTVPFEVRLKMSAAHRGRKKRLGTTSEYRGVSWYARLKKWRAHLWTGGKHIHLGIFGVEEDAARAHDAAARKYGKSHQLNFP